MSFPLRSVLRNARYAFPEFVGRRFPVQSSEEAVEACARIASATGVRISLGYFALPDEEPEAVAHAFIRAARAAKAQDGLDAVLAVKAPPLDFDRSLIGSIAAEGAEIVLDALTPAQAPDTLALAEAFDCGVALPARWERSLDDARRLRDAPVRIRIVKGEWADPEGGVDDVSAAYARIAEVLAGRDAPVHVATHDPATAEEALAVLAGSSTPVELGQLRGLPRRRTGRVAAHHNVPMRYYYPFGPGWWPYAIEQALRKPYLPLWAMRDWTAR